MDKKLILVVDDDRDLVASMEAFLSARGFTVATAGNGKEAYARIVERPPRPDHPGRDDGLRRGGHGLRQRPQDRRPHPRHPHHHALGLQRPGRRARQGRSPRSWARTFRRRPSWRSPCGWPSLPSGSRRCLARESRTRATSARLRRGNGELSPGPARGAHRPLPRAADPATSGDPDARGLSLPGRHGGAGRRRSTLRWPASTASPPSTTSSASPRWASTSSRCAGAPPAM